jgi:predicted transcriptional regulator of viral defense system
MKNTERVALQCLRQFAEERRRIFGDWRLLIECRRVAQSNAMPLPDESYSKKILHELVRRNDAAPVEGISGVFRVDAPYADVLPVTDEQIVQEANPLAVFSHLTALVHHALTDQIPTVIQATHYKPANPGRIPLGTTPEEWVGLPRPPQRRPLQVNGIPIHWYVTKSEWDFGWTISYSQGLPIYVTDIERTLLDVLRSPDDSGGLAVVFRAWRQAQPLMNLDRLIGYTEQLGQAILRQRVGYVLEALGLKHPRLAVWKQKLLRGSSVKLVASAPFASKFSANWNLSLNAPAAVLAELQEE